MRRNSGPSALLDGHALGKVARHIDVAVDRGVVHLGGYVWENDDFQTARRDAASVPGVKTVVAQIPSAPVVASETVLCAATYCSAWARRATAVIGFTGSWTSPTSLVVTSTGQ